MTQDIDAFLDGYEAPVEEVPICGKPGLIAEHARIEAEIIGFRTEGSLAGPPRDLVDRLEEIERQVEESVLVWRLRALPFGAWADLQLEHPPTDEQRRGGHAANPDSFEPAALAACAVEPTVTVAQADRMRATLAPTEWVALMGAVRRLHQERTAAPKSLLLSALRRRSDAYSATQPSEGSLADPSSDDSGEQ